MNFAFAGTPDFAAWVLADLAALSRRPAVVISQPDRPRGRGRKATPPPAVLEADRLGLESVRVEDVNDPGVLARLETAGVSILVVGAFGQILKWPLLEAFLCLNVHASLLPAYRGPAPIERALAAGEPCTGVSIMRMVEGLDEGPWALQTSVSVGPRDDVGSLGRVLALVGAIGVDQALNGLADGTLRWTAQQGPATYAAKLCAADCQLDLGKGAAAVHDQVRSLSPGIGARATSGGVEFKVWRTWPYGEPGLEPVPSEGAGVAGRPGEVQVGSTRLFVGCGQGVVELLMVQPAGKSKMAASDFMRGYGVRLGGCLEPPGRRRPDRQAPDGLQLQG
ncbi:MAG: methionyl-tRNA formyltransferase [bacterium]